MRILLLAGGWSEEKEVSLSGAKAIYQALQTLGHQVILYDLGPNLSQFEQKVRQVDFVFINLHGSPGEDGTIQAILEDLNLPYQGSGPLASFLCLNKNAYKQILSQHSILTPRWTIYKPSTGLLDLPGPFPLILKPNSGGSSVDIQIVHSRQELDQLCLNPAQEYLIEEFISGQELTCGVLDQVPLPPVLIKPKSVFFDYHSKYDPKGAEEICPAPVSVDITQKVQTLTRQIHQLFKLKDYSRTDFILSSTNELYVLETNTIPGMTPTSLFPQEAMAVGIEFTQLIAKLVELGLEKKR